MTRRTTEIAAFFSALLFAVLSFHAWLASRDDQQRLQAALSAQQKIIASADATERAHSASLAGALAQIEKLKRANQTPQQIAAALQDYLSLPRPLALADSTLPEPLAASTGKSEKKRKGSAATDVPNHPELPPGQLPSTQAMPELPVPFVAPCSTPSCGSNAAPGSPALPPSITAALQPPSGPPVACAGPPNCTVEIPSADLKPLYNYVQDCRECQLRLIAANQNLADNEKKMAALTSERDAAVTAAKGGTFWRRLRRNLLWFAVGAAVASAYNAKH